MPRVLSRSEAESQGKDCNAQNPVCSRVTENCSCESWKAEAKAMHEPSKILLFQALPTHEQVSKESEDDAIYYGYCMWHGTQESILEI